MLGFIRSARALISLLIEVCRVGFIADIKCFGGRDQSLENEQNNNDKGKPKIGRDFTCSVQLLGMAQNGC